MSRLKNRNILLVIMFVIISFFAFGCEKEKTPVEDIYIKVEGNEEQIVLLLGQTLELGDYINIKPNYATNKDYYLESYDSSVVSVDKTSIKANKEGSTYIKIISEDDANRHDIINVSVQTSEIVLDTPQNLTYNPTSQSFVFDSVLNAAGYKLEIKDASNNVKFYDLGNTTTFALSEYEGTKYNTVLTASVKAYAASYSFVFKDSIFSDSFKVYQTSDVVNAKIEGGVLTFTQASNSIAQIFYNNELIKEEGNRNVTHSLIALDDKYAGVNLDVKIKASAKNRIDGVNYYDSIITEIPVQVLEELNPLMNGTIISWNNVANVSEYNVYINNFVVPVATTAKNFFDIKELPNFNNYKASSEDYMVKVVPVIAENSVNVAKTEKENIIKFNRLDSVSVTLTEKGISWGEVAKANVYTVVISHGGVETKISTRETEISFENYSAGQYKVTVQALGISLGDVNYVASLLSENSECEFKKLGTTDVVIEDYELKISTPVVGEDYFVTFGVDDDLVISETITASGAVSTMSLKTYNFKPGPHSVNIVRKGKLTSQTIDSPMYSYPFIQLTPIEVISMNNNVLSVNKGVDNSNADNPDVEDDVVIELKVEGGSLPEPKTSNDLSITFNTVDELDRNFLGAGVYTSYVYVKGNGSTTFSYMQSGTLTHSASCEFSVLAAPELTFSDSSKAEFSFTSISESYTIYENGVAKYDDFRGTIYSFDLESGSKTFNVQANGNNRNILSSKLSDVLSVARLNKPTISFDNSTNKLGISYNNDLTLLSGDKYNIKLKNSSEEYADFKEISYTFGDQFTGFVAGENKFRVFLYSVLKKDDVYYLNSKEEEITLNKLSCITTFEINNENQLVICSRNKLQTNLELIFNLGGTEKTFTMVGENFVSDSYILPFNYSVDSDGYGVYTLDLVNDYNVIMPEFLTGFTVKARYKYASDAYVNSDVSTESEELKVLKIDEQSLIKTNENNKLIIKPLSHSKNYYLNVKFTIGGTEYIFTSDANKEFLQYASTKLPYSYKSGDGSYEISLLKSDYIPLFSALTSDFSVQVKYMNKTIASDLDSDYSVTKNIYKLQAATLSRNGQNLVFNNPYNSYNYSNYAIFVNNNQIINLDSSCVNEGTNIIVPFEYIYNKITSVQANTIYSVAVISKNVDTTDDYPLLSTIGAAVKIKKQATPELTTYKFNNNEDGKNNNSAVVEFVTEKNNYAKTYKLTISNGSEDDLKTYIINANEDSKTKSLNLDEISLFGQLEVSLKVETVGVDSDVYVFNSDNSNKLSFNKIVAPSAMSVTDTTLSFSSVPNAVYYELYEVEGSSNYIKLGEAITNNSYDVPASWVGAKKVVLKAISKSGNYTNSAYSQEFTLIRLASPNTIVQDGRFYISNIPSVSVASIELKVYNPVNDKSISIDITGFNNINMNVNGILNYGTDEILAEDIKFTYIVKANTTTDFYLSSAVNTITARGLFAPTNLHKTTSGAGTDIETFVWTANTKNAEYSVNYEFMITYDGRIFTSTDKNLKYLSSGVLHSYGTISSTSIMVPAGYDDNNDGDLEDAEDVVFSSGDYTISVRTIPATATSSDNLCISDYSVSYKVTIMEAPTLTISAGSVIWDKDINATSYEMDIYKFGLLGSTFEKTVTLTNNIYNLDNLAGGIYEITLKSKSSKQDVLNSVESKAIMAFKLAKPSKVYVDDGNLILTASKYFNVAKITFTYGGKSETINYTNENLAINLGDLSLTNYTDENSYFISLDEFVNSGELNLQSGKSYSVEVELIGTNSYNLEVFGSTRTVGIVSSDVKTNAITALKFKPTIKSAEAGKYTFMPDSAYCEIDVDGATFTKASTCKLAYDFHNVGVDNVDNFWKETIVYKIDLTIKEVTGGSDVTYTLLAVDYFSCAKGNASYNETFIEHNGVKYNIFKNNVIDLTGDELFVYSTQIVRNEVTFTYQTSEEQKFELNLGGVFVLSVSMMGGDSSDNVGYLNSKPEVVTFVRYGEITPFSDSGCVSFVDGRKNTEKNDSPVYAVFAKNIANSKTKMFYLYYSTEDDAKYVVGSRYTGTDYELGGYYDVKFSADYANNIVFDLGLYVESGAYSVKVKTLAGLDTNIENDIYYLDAKDIDSSYNYYKFSDCGFEYKNGALEMTLAHISLDDGKFLYSGEYEITLSEGANEVVYTINSTSEGVEIVGNKLTYIVPASIAVPGKTYTIKARPLATAYNAAEVGFSGMLLNGTYKKDGGVDVFVQFTKASALAVADVNIKNGVLTWNAPSYKAVNVKVYSEVESETFYFEAFDDELDASGLYSYPFSDNAYSCINGNIYVMANCNYKISIQLIGSGNEINSDYSEYIKDIRRLENVESSSIKADNGVLTWRAVDGAVYYIVNVDTLTYTVTTNSLDLTKPDDNGNVLTKGSNYNIVIKAIGNLNINSVLTKSYNFDKLDVVTDSTIRIEDAGIAWDEADRATYYRVVYKFNGESKEYLVPTTYCEAPDGIDGAFEVLIQAFVEGKNKTIASDFVSFSRSVSKPSPVDLLKYDSAKFRFEVRTDSSDFQDGDRLKITCDITIKTENGKTKTSKLEEIFEFERGFEYVYDLEDIGMYSNFTAQILREDTFGSNKEFINQINFDIYEFGNGDKIPYAIKNAEQFLNIRHFASRNRNFVLKDNIYLKDVNYSKTGYIISEEFNGILDGNNQIIKDFANTINGKQTINLEKNVNNFALFKNLNGATIKNLQIGENSISTILLNTFDSDVKNMLNLSMIATGANNSIITGVRINNFTIKLGGNAKIAKQVKIAGLVCDLLKSDVKGNNVNLTVEIEDGLTINSGNDLQYFYIAGLLATSNAGIIGGDLVEEKNNSTLTLIHKNPYSALDYVSGAVAFAENNSLIKGANVELYIDSTKIIELGGVVGYANITSIFNSSVNGRLKFNSDYSNVNIGGVVGRGYCINVESANVAIEILNASLKENQNLGGIVGFVDGDAGAGYVSSIKDSLFNSNKFTLNKTEYKNNKLTLGVYGKAYESFEPSNCVA